MGLEKVHEIPSFQKFSSEEVVIDMRLVIVVWPREGFETLVVIHEIDSFLENSEIVLSRSV
jgi:hypothetical protein